MDINEFQLLTQPKAKRSKLDRYKNEIFMLKERGYANWQIRDWLVSNGIRVSQEAVRKFIRSREASGQPHVQFPLNASPQSPLTSENRDTKMIPKEEVATERPRVVSPFEISVNSLLRATESK